MKIHVLGIAILSAGLMGIAIAEPVGVDLLQVYSSPTSSSGGAGGSSTGSAFGQVFEKHEFSSTNSRDAVTIANGSDSSIQVVIYVDRGDSQTTTGISVQNCGEVTHVAAGSTAVCSTSGGNTPILITSDNGAKSASGSYQIK